MPYSQESPPNKNAKMSIAFESQHSAFNATKAYPDEINFYRLIDYLERLSFECSLDQEKLKTIMNQAAQIEEIGKNYSNILMRFHKDFLMDAREKIMKHEFDKEHTNNLANYVVEKISEMTLKLEPKNDLQTAPCPPEPPSGEIFQENKAEENDATEDAPIEVVNAQTPQQESPNAYYNPHVYEQSEFYGFPQPTNVPFIPYHNVHFNYSLAPQYFSIFVQPVNSYYRYNGQVFYYSYYQMP